MDNDVDTINICIDEVKKRKIDIDYINVKLLRKTYSDEEINRIKDKEVSLELSKEIFDYLRNKIDKSIDQINDVNAILIVKQFVVGRKY